jgi:hypothetical protein
MEFLCPNCQKMLQVPDQHAGTMMMCPLCKEKFQAPALPSEPPPLPAAAPNAPAAPDHPEVYAVEEPPAVPGAAAAPPPTRAAAPAPKSPPPPPPPPSLATDYRGGLTIPFSPRVLPWIAAGALVPILILLFLPWLGYYWNGQGVLTQNAWGAAFGYWGTPPQEWTELSGLPNSGKDAIPSWNGLILLYLPLFFLTLLVTVLSAVLTVVPIKLPAEIDRLKPWRWALVAGLCLLTLLILVGQSLKGYSMENQARAQVTEKVKNSADRPRTDEEAALRIGKEYNALGIEHTTVLRLVFLLELVALVAAALQLWVEVRGSAQPVPRLELRW